jgi:hypothetical protein
MHGTNILTYFGHNGNKKGLMTQTSPIQFWGYLRRYCCKLQQKRSTTLETVPVHINDYVFETQLVRQSAVKSMDL